ncbi:hypothetical protein ABVT39_013720 [Epinephelus coioides]
MAEILALIQCQSDYEFEDSSDSDNDDGVGSAEEEAFASTWTQLIRAATELPHDVCVCM